MMMETHLFISQSVTVIIKVVTMLEHWLSPDLQRDLVDLELELEDARQLLEDFDLSSSKRYFSRPPEGVSEILLSKYFKLELE